MTPDQGYDLAKFQRPGVKIVMGPTEAIEVPVEPLSDFAISGLPGDRSWFVRDLRLRLGFTPSPWAVRFATQASVNGHEMTKDDWEWLHGSKSTLDGARKWIAAIAKGKETK